MAALRISEGVTLWHLSPIYLQMPPTGHAAWRNNEDCREWQRASLVGGLLMTNKPRRARKPHGHGKPRKQKYSSMEESDISAWWVSKKRNGYYLYGNKLGQVGDASATICEGS